MVLLVMEEEAASAPPSLHDHGEIFFECDEHVGCESKVRLADTWNIFGDNLSEDIDKGTLVRLTNLKRTEFNGKLGICQAFDVAMVALVFYYILVWVVACVVYRYVYMGVCRLLGWLLLLLTVTLYLLVSYVVCLSRALFTILFYCILVWAVACVMYRCVFMGVCRLLRWLLLLLTFTIYIYLCYVRF